MDIKIVKPSLTDVEIIERKNEESLPQSVIDSGNEGEIAYIATKQVLDLERDDTSYDDEINILTKWAKQQVDDDDPMALKWAIRDLRMRLGTPNNEDSIKHLARFAYLDREEKRIKKEKRDFI